MYFEGMWKALAFFIRKAVEHSKWSLMKHPIWHLEDSVKSNRLWRPWSKDFRGEEYEQLGKILFLWYLGKTVAVFCLLSLDFEAKLQSNGLSSFLQDISKQTNIVSVMWFLIITFMELSNEKEQVEQKEIQNALREKKSIRKFILMLECWLLSLMRGLTQNGLKWRVPSRQDSTQITSNLWKLDKRNFCS